MSLNPQRQLELAYSLFHKPFAWRCTLCRRLFAPRSSRLTTEQVEEISREFRVHLCWPVKNAETAARYEKPKSWLPERFFGKE